MLKKYKVEIEELNKYYFCINAINEESAEKAVIDIIENTEIIDMKLFEKKSDYNYKIKPLYKNENLDIYIL